MYVKKNMFYLDSGKLSGKQFCLTPQPEFTCSKSTIETPEQYMKSVQS